jgi:hypothetical protein
MRIDPSRIRTVMAEMIRVQRRQKSSQSRSESTMVQRYPVVRSYHFHAHGSRTVAAFLQVVQIMQTTSNLSFTTTALAAVPGEQPAASNTAVPVSGAHCLHTARVATQTGVEANQNRNLGTEITTLAVRLAKHVLAHHTVGWHRSPLLIRRSVDFHCTPSVFPPPSRILQRLQLLRSQR